MLFSNPAVADFVNRNFEPAFHMVRPAPIINIDFGNGTVITRTLHGNVATLICNAGGQVIDILPGIYEPVTYLDRLEQLQMLFEFIVEQSNRQTQLIKYHTQRALALEEGRITGKFVRSGGNRFIESKRQVVWQEAPANVDDGLPRPTFRSAEFVPSLQNAAELAKWNLLVQDTREAELLSRRLIHDNLSATPLSQPDEITKWLFKDVLNVDLDDPYLGLSDSLFPNYPFRAEDEASS